MKLLGLMKLVSVGSDLVVEGLKGWKKGKGAWDGNG